MNYYSESVRGPSQTKTLDLLVKCWSTNKIRTGMGGRWTITLSRFKVLVKPRQSGSNQCYFRSYRTWSTNLFKSEDTRQIPGQRKTSTSTDLHVVRVYSGLYQKAAGSKSLKQSITEPHTDRFLLSWIRRRITVRIKLVSQLYSMLTDSINTYSEAFYEIMLWPLLYSLQSLYFSSLPTLFCYLLQQNK